MPKLSIEEFNALPKRQKKVLVAKDILKQLRAKKYKASHTYMSINTIAGGNWEQLKDADIHTTGMADIESCKVCELGACVLSIAKFANSLTFNQVNTAGAFDPSCRTKESRKVNALLLSVFSPEEIKLLEACFEGGSSPYYSNMRRGTKASSKTGGMYADAFPNSSKRMMAISKNIIRNEGRFIAKQDLK